MSNLTKHAEVELDALVQGSSLNKLDEQFAEAVKRDVLALIRLFASQGHSGGSAMTVLGFFEKLARYEPLSPLTGDSDEWVEIEAGRLYQNKRASNVFKENEIAYQMDGFVFKEPNGATFTTQPASRRRIVRFPFRPQKGVVIQVNAGDDPMVALEAAGYEPFGAESDGA
jgi:hypothetical protein